MFIRYRLPTTWLLVSVALASVMPMLFASSPVKSVWNDGEFGVEGSIFRSVYDQVTERNQNGHTNKELYNAEDTAALGAIQFLFAEPRELRLQSFRRIQRLWEEAKWLGSDFKMRLYEIPHREEWKQLSFPVDLGPDISWQMMFESYVEPIFFLAQDKAYATEIWRNLFEAYMECKTVGRDYRINTFPWDDLIILVTLMCVLLRAMNVTLVLFCSQSFRSETHYTHAWPVRQDSQSRGRV
jgi:hypothetical protein